MTRRNAWAASIIPLWSVGLTIGKLHRFLVRPETFFVLGVAATLCVGGGVYYAKDAVKTARARKRYGN